MLDFLLYLGGAICFVVTAIGGTLPRVNLLALGLFLWILVPLIAAVPK